MERSEPNGLTRIAARAAWVSLPVLLVACSSPSKSDALKIVQSGVKEDGSCTLPVSLMAKLKVQHASKGLCVPKEGAADAAACVDALVAAGVTAPKPASYMVAWPDEVTGVSLKDVPAYERRARNLLFQTCVELRGDLRDGRFTCADAAAENVRSVTKGDDAHAEVRYTRALTFRPFVADLEKACPGLVRPPTEASVALEKGESGWALATAPPTD